MTSRMNNTRISAVDVRQGAGPTAIGETTGGQYGSGATFAGETNVGPTFAGETNDGPTFAGDTKDGPTFAGDTNDGPRLAGDTYIGFSTAAGETAVGYCGKNCFLECSTLEHLLHPQLGLDRLHTYIISLWGGVPFEHGIHPLACENRQSSHEKIKRLSLSQSELPGRLVLKTVRLHYTYGLFFFSNPIVVFGPCPG